MSGLPERICNNPYAGHAKAAGPKTYTTEYIRADLAVLSSAAVAEREPDSDRSFLLRNAVTRVSELEAENASLRSELEYQKKVSADRWETAEQQAYAFDDMRIRAEA